MPARTEPVIDTSWGISCSTRARPVSRSPQITFMHAGREELGHHLGHHHGGHRRGVRRLEHDGVAGGDGRAPTSTPPSSSGSSTGRPGRRRRWARGGSSTCGRPCTRRPTVPSSMRAAPAKNRIWSIIGGISSDAVSPSGLPVFSRLGRDELVGARLEGVGDLQQRELTFARRGVAPRLERGLRGPTGRGRRRPGPRRPTGRTPRRWTGRPGRRCDRRPRRRPRHR